MLPHVLTLFLTIAGPNATLDSPGVPGAIAQAEPGRFISPRSYDDTLKYFRRYFNARGGVRWRSIVNLPSVKAQHIESLRKKTKWEGINIYETKGRVHYYVIPRHATPD